MGEFKPIETRYKGYRFRSRLEARWAVFFDALQMPYKYEPEGYALSNGEAYLPDFYLPTEDMFAEVKPYREGVENELKKVVQFAEDSKKPVLLLPDIPQKRDPDCWWYSAIYYHALKGFVIVNRVAVFKDEENAWIERDLFIGDLVRHNPESTGGFLKRALNAMNDEEMPYEIEERRWGKEEVFRVGRDWYPMWSEVSKALDDARSARFEHGEKGSGYGSKKNADKKGH